MIDHKRRRVKEGSRLLESSTIGEMILEPEALKVCQCAVEVVDLFLCSGYLGGFEGGFDGFDTRVRKGCHGCRLICVVEEIFIY